MTADPLVIGDLTFTSRLFTGTGKYRSATDMEEALRESGTELVTVAVRRLERGELGSNFLDQLDLGRYRLLPNTAGATTAAEAVRIARLGRELGLSDLVKLEVIGDPVTLLPDPVATIEATAILAAEGFVVFPYTSQDPIVARRLVEAGAAVVMPYGSPIGSGQGIPDLTGIQLIRERVSVPVIVDAGLGAPSDAALAMEMGADAVLVNTAIAEAGQSGRMARAFRMGVEAGREAYLAGRIPKRQVASPSSPVTGRVGS